LNPAYLYFGKLAFEQHFYFELQKLPVKSNTSGKGREERNKEESLNSGKKKIKKISESTTKSVFDYKH